MAYICFELCEEANPALFFLSDVKLSNGDFFALMYILCVMLLDLFAANLTYSFDLSFLNL